VGSRYITHSSYFQRQRYKPVVIVVNDPDMSVVVPVVPVPEFPAEIIRPAQIVIIIVIEFKASGGEYIIIIVPDNGTVIAG
jgi:hypothetical protein